MSNIFIVAIVALLAGLLMVAFAVRIGVRLLEVVVWWIGVVLIVFGAVLLLAPVVAWLDVQIRTALRTG